MAKNNFEVGFVFGAKKAATFDKTLSGMEKAIGGLGQKIGSITKGIAGLASAYIGVTALTGIGKQAIESASGLEGYRSTLNVVLKDSEKAAKTMQWAVDFANKTPFETDSIVEATVRLESYGLKAQEVMPQIGDMAGVMNKDIMQAVEAVADAQTGELERMKEFGITKAMIAEKSAQMYRGVEIINAKGQIVDQEKFNKALFGLMEDRFKGGMDIQAGSFKGLMSTVQGVWKTGLASMAGISSQGEIIDGSLFDMAKEGIAGVAEKLQKLAKDGSFERFGVILGKGLAFVIDGGRQLATNVLPVITRFKDHAVKAFTWISDIAKESFGKIKAVLSESGEKFAAFGEVAGRIGSEVKEFLEKGFQNAKPVIEWIAVEGLPEVAGFLGDVAQGAADVYNFFTTNWPTIEPIVIGIGAAFALWKLPDILGAGMNGLLNFGGALKALPGVVGKATGAQLTHIKSLVADKIETIKLVGMYAKDFVSAIWGNIKALGASTKAWLLNKGAMVGQRAAALKTRAVSMASSMWATVKAVGASTGAWIANKAAMVGHKVATLALKGVQLISAGATTVMTAAQWALNAAFIASPIGWVVLGIGALIAIGILLWKNWDTVKAKALELWDGMKSAFGSAVSWFQGIWSGVTGAFDNFMSGLSAKCPLLADIIMVPVNTIKGVLDGLKQAFHGLTTFVSGVFTGDWQKAWEGVKGIFGGIFESFASLAKTPINAVIAVINGAIRGINGINISVPDWVPGMGGQSFGFTIPEIPALATGGIVTSPTLAMIGEGRESEAVLPLSKLAGMLGGAAAMQPRGGMNVGDSSAAFMGILRQFLDALEKPKAGNGGAEQLVFSPTVNVTVEGNADESTLREAIRKALEEFREEIRRIVKEMEWERNRTAFDR